MDILHTQMDTAGSDGFGQAIVGVVLMVGEDGLSPGDEAGGNGLGTDVHQPPLIQTVLVQVNTTGIDGIPVSYTHLTLPTKSLV